MTLIQVSDGTNVFTIDQGLTGSIEQTLTNHLTGHFIDICTEQMINYIKTIKSNDGISGVSASASFPEFPAGKNENITSNMKLPIIVVTTQLGVSKEVGIGRGITNSIKGTVRGFRQYVHIEFDCHATSELEAARLAGWLLFSMQRDKMSLQRNGFIDIRQLYSNSAKGFSPAYGFDINSRFYPVRVFRHLAYIETMFDVIWIEEDTDTSVISMIVFDETSSYSLSDVSMGMSLDYLLAEELYYGWHSILF